MMQIDFLLDMINKIFNKYLSMSWDNRQDSTILNAGRLYYHCFLKGIQAGSVIGLLSIAPLLIRRNFNAEKMATRIAYSSLTGVTLSLGMCTAKVLSW